MPYDSVQSKHLLTVLVEDYFHVGAFEDLIQQRNWDKFDSRYAINTRKTLDLIDEFETKATFFVLGWIAERDPSLVREIAERGHEVASRGFYHRGLSNLTADEFRADVMRANDAIEAATGRKVRGYRAAEKLSYERDGWVAEILADVGMTYDASFMPKRSDRRERWFAHQIATPAGVLWEFPYSTRDLGLGLLPIAGGNYFRQIPYTLTRGAVRDWHRRTEAPFVSYFHVWELDPEQPRISAASRRNRLRHYRKLDKMEWILRENLSAYRCESIAEHLGLTEVDVVPDRKGWSADTGRVETSRVLEKVTIVIPAYNEVDALPYLANALKGVSERIRSAGYSPEFLFVDDRSTDTTHEMLKQMFGDRDGYRIIRHESNQGVAAAILTGIRASQTEIVCSIDCDCTYDPEELANMIPLLRDGVDMVTGSPYHERGSVRNVPGWRLFLSRGASALYRTVLNTKLDTYTSCFRVYRRSSMIGLDIRETGFLGVAEMLGKLDLAGGRIVEFPAVLDVRLFGISKMKTVKTIGGHLKLLTRLAKHRLFRKNDVIEPSYTLENRSR